MKLCTSKGVGIIELFLDRTTLRYGENITFEGVTFISPLYSIYYYDSHLYFIYLTLSYQTSPSQKTYGAGNGLG